MAAQTGTYELPFDLEGFKASFDAVRPLILEEWPAVDPEALDKTEGDPHAVLAVITDATSHSKALVRKHLAEIAEVAGVGATGLEARLVRLLHFLEGKAEPVQARAEQLVEEVTSRGTTVARDVKEKVHEAEDTMKENLWVTLLAALGVGLLAGLVVGLTRGR